MALRGLHSSGAARLQGAGKQDRHCLFSCLAGAGRPNRDLVSLELTHSLLSSQSLLRRWLLLSREPFLQKASWASQCTAVGETVVGAWGANQRVRHWPNTVVFNRGTLTSYLILLARIKQHSTLSIFRGLGTAKVSLWELPEQVKWIGEPQRGSCRDPEAWLLE